jgi:hypothetical protein
MECYNLEMIIRIRNYRFYRTHMILHTVKIYENLGKHGGSESSEL